MPLEYKTLKFTNDSTGLREKDATLARWAAAGWRVVGETIEQGHFRGGNACCLASICPPMGFLAGRTAGYIAVTLVREATSGIPGQLMPVGVVDIEAQERNDMMVGGLVLGGIVLLIIIWLWLN